MEYFVKNEIGKNYPWSVYAIVDGYKVFKAGFKDKDEADDWIQETQKRQDHPGESPEWPKKGVIFKKPDIDKVDEASIESFPSSDPRAKPIFKRLLKTMPEPIARSR